MSEVADDALVIAYCERTRFSEVLYRVLKAIQRVFDKSEFLHESLCSFCGYEVADVGCVLTHQIDLETVSTRDAPYAVETTS